MTRCIMVQGTMSGAGKSLLVTALCRILRQDGLSVAPFKSQNMALNSYVTSDGLEMGRAQVVQAQAAGIEPDVRMNPILLKPSSDVGSQLIVCGEVRGHYDAKTYFSLKHTLIPEIMAAYESLAREYDVIVIEGAGSPAEINLRDGDIVNMGLAELVDAPVLLVGDIDRGGVFAQLHGTLALLRPDERSRVVGTVINKFRGDVALLQPGLAQLEELTSIPVLGVVPYVRAEIDDEDSLSERLHRTEGHRPIDVAVIRLPRISNFTDFAPLERHAALGVRYVSDRASLGEPDLVIIPGTKSTMDDLLWIRQNGLEMAIRRLCDSGTVVLGICGGYQMMGMRLIDPDGVERGGELAGMGLLPCETTFSTQKTRTRVRARIVADGLADTAIQGYEIHMGRTQRSGGMPFARLDSGDDEGCATGCALGTYLHGLFDTGEAVDALARWLLTRKGLSPDEARTLDHAAYQDQQIDLLADAVRASLDMEAIYRAMQVGASSTAPTTPPEPRITEPTQIEARSMQIIEAGLRARGVSLPPEELAVLQRVIHTTADFGYVDNLVFAGDAARAGIAALVRGCTVVTDTHMAEAGISKPALARLGAELRCFVTDADVIGAARATHETRATMAMRKALASCPGAILAVGNAPTALFELCAQLRAGARPALVIGVPVGFVNVVEAKDEVLACCREFDIPAIVARGRKGGSTVATSIVNALAYAATGRRV